MFISNSRALKSSDVVFFDSLAIFSLPHCANWPSLFIVDDGLYVVVGVNDVLEDAMFPKRVRIDNVGMR